jgi:hypothetical protein
MADKQICEHCGQELIKASLERQDIRDTQLENIDKVGEALSERQDKLDDASAEMLAIIQRIEAKVGADVSTLQEVKDLELKIRARIQKQYDAEENK